MDKEQIIIDGIDISECEYICNTAFGNIGCKLPFNEEIYCCNISNCYYKQLARKTQECEQIKEKYEALKLENQEGYEIVDELKQECEELKKELNLYKTWYRAKHGDIKNYLGRCYNALDEIKEIVKDWYKNEWSCYMCRKNMDKKLEDILDIINKAKGGE